MENMITWRPRATGVVTEPLDDDDRSRITRGLPGYATMFDDVNGDVEVDFDVEAPTEAEALAAAHLALAQITSDLASKGLTAWTIQQPIDRS